MNLLADHLWQSTLFAGATWVLTLALRKNSARARHWLWFAASLKFLIPLSPLVALGGHIDWRKSPAIKQSNAVVVMNEVSRPFTAPMDSYPLLAAVPPARSSLPTVLFAAWGCGFIGISCSWWFRWRRIGGAVRAASPLQLEIQIEARSYPTLMEPGIFGTFRPVLLLLEGIAERLTPRQLKAVIAHELCHIRHRDNLIAAIHMFVETVFWFHPLVWWIGKRMVEERERACDEEVLLMTGEPRAYAEGILNVCKLYVESPMACVSGVTGGSNLKQRIEAIMTNRIVLKLNFGKKLALAVAGMATLALPTIIGIVNAPAIQAQSAAAAKFEVVSVKPTTGRGFDPGNIIDLNLLRGMTRDSRDGRFRMEGVPLNFLSQLAYNVKDLQVLGGPSWANSDRYEVNAKAEGDATFEQMRPMLQSLLADRFRLTLHRETKELPVYELTVAKGGLKIAAAKAGSCVTLDPNNPPPPLKPGSPPPPLNICGGVRRQIAGTPPERIDRIEAVGISMPRLIEMLSDEVGRTVIDKTGFTGTFDVHLEFAPDENIVGGLGPSPPSGNLSSPSITTAVQEQLGLRLQSAKGPVEVLVIDHVERPSEN